MIKADSIHTKKLSIHNICKELQSPWVPQYDTMAALNGTSQTIHNVLNTSKTNVRAKKECNPIAHGGGWKRSEVADGGDNGRRQSGS
jgi:hypothetical protein